MSRFVRGASLLCDGTSDRKLWLENRIEEPDRQQRRKLAAPAGEAQKRPTCGHFFAASGEKLRDIASCLNVRRVITFAGGRGASAESETAIALSGD